VAERKAATPVSGAGRRCREKAAHFTFPWLADIAKIQTAGGEAQPLQTHPHHVFWAMPRRIRLDFASVQTGQCDICKRESTQLIHRYLTRPQGLNYKAMAPSIFPILRDEGRLVARASATRWIQL
jgi:hypothetical protein